MKHQFEKIEIIGAAIVALFGIVFIAVSAASAPKKMLAVCTQDVWTCDDWRACDGRQQTRICTMRYDCPTTATPKPNESRACVAAVRGCEGAEWTCDDWRACDADGAQSRACHLVHECPGLAMTRPQTKRDCPLPQCEDGTVRERAACRLKLSLEGRAHLASLGLTPEACRVLNDVTARSACAAAIALFRPCLGNDDGLSCARTVLGLSEDIVAAKADCVASTGTEKIACLDTLRFDAKMLVIFRIDNLISRAIKTYDNAGSLAATTDFVSAATQAESAFLGAMTDSGQTAAVQAVSEAWNRFSGTSDNGLQDALRSLHAAK